MKNKSFIKLITLLACFPMLLTSCNKEPVVGPQGEQGIPGEQGVPGNDGVSITSIEKTSSQDNIDTYTITYSDGHTSTFTVTNGVDGEKGVQGEPGENGHTPKIEIGDNGNWFVDNVDTGIKAQGPQGISVVSIEKTNSEGLVDTYTITYSDGNTSTFTVTNGADGAQGIQGKPGENGHTPKIEIGDNGNWFVDNVDTGIKAQGPKGDDGLTPYIGDNGNWWIGDEDTNVKAAGDKGNDGVSIVSVNKTNSEGLIDTYTITFSNGNTFEYVVTNGIQGEKGDDGASILTGHGLPNSNDGKDGDSYIDLDTWNYYVKTLDEWEESGNIKGKQGDKGDTGVSVVNSQIDDNGDLIVELSNGESVNAGHIKDTNEYTVKFYCDELLVDTQLVKHGEKIELPQLDDFVVKHWYLDKDFEYEWLWYGCVVTEDMSLYGKYTPVVKSLSFDKTANISIDGYGYGEALSGSKEICVSKADETADFLTALEDRGILFNKEEIGYIDEITLNIAETGFSSAKIYYGNNPLSFENFYDLSTGINNVNLSGAEYFTIQNASGDLIYINSLEISYTVKTRFYDESLPTVVINTKNSQAVTSRITYVDCDVSTIGADKDVSELKAQIKVRGNSTANCPKKPYRIKLNKKNSLFGYEKAKNWVLLADYMDGSNMHNYTALKFAKMIRGEDSFGVDPLHVNVILNGENIGLYEFGEHIDTKEGRLNIEQDNIWEKSFDEINFYIERDSSTLTDPLEKEGTTYFKVPLENYSPSQYVFALKYPEKEDFEEELDNGEIDTHEEEFQSFFNSLKDYMTDICNKFVAYSNDASEFANVSSSVDVQSLAEYAVIDQMFRESDHNQKSFKMYRENGGLLKFGPNWDYDSCTYGLPYQGTYVLNPFADGWNNFESTYFGDKWGYMLFNDVENGRPLFKNIWNSVSNEMIDNFINAQKEEMNCIAASTMFDCERWMNNQYYSLFDNQQYYWKWVETQLPYLNNYYSNL